MKNLASHFLFTSCLLTAFSSPALDLKQSKFTQVVNDVQIISGADKSTKSAALNDVFKMPDVLRTGPNSRAELVAEDQTITRVGANTVFAFDPANRTIDLQKGSLLFHSPKGKGGGTIRTGSATASVLGTTIVVTTTAAGGFKLLVMEGEAEIKFLSGLKQHLSAGQMTFILPGGGMSPIIVFRLDANTKGNPLIKDFPRPLPSTSKIGDAINRQAKLIAKGKAQDTGLLVGDTASPTEVQAWRSYLNQPGTEPYRPVLDGNAYRTIDGWLVEPNNPETTPLSDALAPARALSTDVSINSSTLSPQRTFVGTGPFRVTIPKDLKCSEFLPNPFSGYFGRNININSRHIDLSPYSLVQKFDFLAAQNININGSLSFDGFVPELYLTAGERITIDPGSTLSAVTFHLYLQSCKAMDFRNVNLQIPIGGISLASLESITLRGGSIAAPAQNFISPRAAFEKSVNLMAGTDVNINGTRITADSLTAHATKSITINGGAIIAAPTVTLTAGDGILLNNVTMTGNRFHATATKDVHISNTDLSSYADLNISGHTLVFENTPFNGSVTLKSDLGLLAGQPNTGQDPLRGYVNFVRGVTYNNVLVTDANKPTIVNPLSGPGIYISPR